MTSSIRASRTSRRRGRVVALVAVGGLMLAACGDDDATSATDALAGPADSTETPSTEAPSTDAPSTDPAPTEAPSDTDATEVPATATSDGATACVGEATGDPVKVGVLWPEGAAISLPELGESAHAAIAYGNECLAGIGGRPVEAVDCQIDETNPASATDCANQMVEEGVEAVVVTITSQGATIVPILTGAGIPYVVSGGTSPAESNNDHDLVFSVGGGVAATLGAMADLASENGYAKVSLIVSENAAPGVGGLAGIPFGEAGVEVEAVPVPAGTPDLTPQLGAALSGGAEATAIIGDGTLCIGYLQAAAAIDPDGEHWVISTCAAEQVAGAVGAEALDGATVFGAPSATADHPESTLYQDVMAEYAPDTPISGFAPTGYAAALSLIRGTAGLEGDVTAATIAEAMRATKDVPIPAGFGTTFSCSETPFPPLSATCAGESVIATMDGSTLTDLRVVDAAPLYGS